MEASLLLPPPVPAGDYDHCVVLHDVPWSQYAALDAARGDSAVPRLTYDQGVLEIMSPATNHERVKTTIARLIECWADETSTTLNGYGSWTVKSKKLARGLEPDECYVRGTVPGKRPDIALEVIWTSRMMDKLVVYAALGVPEVWVWEDGKLAVHVLRGRRYARAARSTLLPSLDLALVTRFATYEDQTLAVKRFRAALRRR